MPYSAGVRAAYGVLGFVLGWGGIGVWGGLVIGLAVASVLLNARFWKVTMPSLHRSIPQA